MSLKRSILKGVKAFIAILLIFNNISICGMGIKAVIAENSDIPVIEMKLENKKYVQYMKVVEEVKEEQIVEGEQKEQEVIEREIKTVALQSKLSVYPNYRNEIYLPTKNVEVSIYLPRINGYTPEEASILKASTFSTTGEEVNNRINQSYDKNSGLLVIAYENIENEEGQIYSQYKENAKDEFEIIYTYPAESYTGNENEIKLTYIIDVEGTFVTENGTIASQNATSIELTEKENKKDVATFDITKLNERIYKGAMYSNVENKTEYEVEYQTEAELVILNNTVLEELEIGLREKKFVLDNDEEISSNGNIEYKSTGISKDDFNKILGQNGIVEIYQNGNIYATIKYIEIVEENETIKKLAVIYSEENVKIITDEEEIITVDYAEGTTNIKIKTTQPETEGKIRIYNRNKIKASEDYGAQVKNIKQIKTLTYANSYEGSRKIALLEPETKIDMNLSTTSFSTLQAANIQATVKLDSTNLSTKLFNNPIIKVILPEGIETGRISSLEIINGNGLEIDREKSGTDNNIITIQLKGRQTQYDLSNVSGGASIVFDIDNLKYKSTIAAHTDKVEVECIQEEIVKKGIPVEITSRYGLLIHSVTKGYNKEEVTTNIDSSIKEISISEKESKKEIEQTVTLVNNYGEDLTNVEIIGKLGYSDSEVSSTFDTNLTKGIEVNKEGAKVYYSENKDASIEDESWSEEYTSNAKLYKVVLAENKLLKEEKVEIKIKAEIPANLGYNQETYIRTQANYICGERYLEDSSTIGMSTPVVVEKKEEQINSIATFSEVEDLEIGTSVTVGGQALNEGDPINEGQIVRYNVVLKNNTENKIENLQIQTQIENAVYYEIDVIGNASEDQATGYVEKAEDDLIRNKTINIKPNQTVVFDYQVVVKENVENVKSLIKVLKNETVIYERQLNNSVNEAEIKIKVESEYNEEYLVYTGNTLGYMLKVTNISGKDLKDVIVACPIPEELVFDTENLIMHFRTIDELQAFDDIYKEGNIVYFKINRLEPDETRKIMIRPILEDLDSEILRKDLSIGIDVSVNNTTYKSNDIVKTVYQKDTKLEANITTNIIEGTFLKNGDEIILNINLSNNGGFNLEKIYVEMIARQCLKIKKYKLPDGKEIVLEDNTTQIGIEDLKINSKEKLNIIVYAEVKEESEVYENTKLELYIYDDLGNRISSANLKYNLELPKTEREPSTRVDDLENDVINEGEIPTQKTESNNQEQPENPDNSENLDNTGTSEEQKKYTISGQAWLDENKNGKKDNAEKLIPNVVATLINKETGNYVLNSEGNKIRKATNSNGIYKFENLLEGKYIVMFEFDTQNYNITTYKKDGVDSKVNSDVVLENITINGDKKLVAITNEITLNSNKENIDIGLAQKPVFDLELDKKISKITVINTQGTQETEFEKGDTAKVDLVAKYMAGSEVIVKYKFTVKNIGEVTGYVDSLVDDLPSGLEFNSELNKDWYKGTDGKLYTTSLSGIAIKSGESAEIELILTKTMTEENAGVFPNSAKLEKISNLENILEKEEATQNNESSAMLFISIKTGSVILYIGITIACIIILAIGSYVINKKILKKEI